MQVRYESDDPQHVCSFSIEHRANWTEVLFSCACGRTPSEVIRRLIEENKGLREQIDRLTRKK